MENANPNTPQRFQVEVAYALSERQIIIPVEVETGATLREAIERSGILEKFPEIDLASVKVGVFGKLSKMDKELRAKDRVEIYRPLIADPKEVRKQRAADGKRMKKGGGDAEE
jgi:putative ubiquitin-RnfH superfamily antitoxin RatB of RatAB toxin-antitoxin module